MSCQDEKTLELEVRRAFSAMPWGQGKRALGELVLRVARGWEHLRCPQAQGDGLPCADLEPDCALCRGWLKSLQVLTS